MWLVHSTFLLMTYLDAETNSQVSINTEQLDFPTVSICNINPIRENTVDRFGSERLNEYIELLRPTDAHMNNTQPVGKRRRRRKVPTYYLCKRRRRRKVPTYYL